MRTRPGCVQYVQHNYCQLLTTQLQRSVQFNMVTAGQNALPSVHYRNKVNTQQKTKKHLRQKSDLCA